MNEIEVGDLFVRTDDPNKFVFECHGIQILSQDIVNLNPGLYSSTIYTISGITTIVPIEKSLCELVSKSPQNTNKNANSKIEVNKCTCNIMILMSTGCKCGHISKGD